MFFDVSKVDIITSKIEWKIYNLNKLKDYMDSDQFLTSKQFYSRKCPSVAWELRVYPYTSTYTYTKRGRQYLMGTAVSLSQKRKINVDLNAKYKIYVVNSNGEYINIVLREREYFTRQQPFTDKYLIELQKVFHSDGSLLLCCEVEFVPYNIECVEDIINDFLTFNISHKPFNNMYKQGILTDFVIKIGNEQIKTHRCVLANNSEVFQRMFEQENMIEAKNGEINIVDSSPKCVRALLDYFYNREINKKILEKLVYELYAIAHKYEVKSLMDKCEHIMASKVDVNSFAENLKYIHIYNLPILEKACVTFITTNRMTFLDSKEWKDLKQLYKDKAIDLLEAAFKNC